MPFIGSAIRAGAGFFRVRRLARHLDALKNGAERESRTPVLDRYDGVARFDRAMRLADATLRVSLRDTRTSASEWHHRYFTFIVSELERAKEALSAMHATRDQVATLAIAVKVARHDLDERLTNLHQRVDSLDGQLSDRLTALDTQAAQDRERSRELEASQGRHFAAIAHSIEGIDRRLEGLATDLDSRLNTESSARRAEVARLESNLNGVTVDLERHKSSVARLEEAVSELRVGMSHERQRVDRRIIAVAALNVFAIVASWAAFLMFARPV